MAKTRMTNALRDAATWALFTHATEKQMMELVENEDFLASEAVRDILGVSYRRLTDVPQSWLTKTSCIRVNANSWSGTLYFGPLDDTAISLPYLDQYGRINYRHVRQMALPAAVFDNKHQALDDAELSLKVQKHLTAAKDFKEKSGRLFNSISGTIAGFKNLESLFEAIPELAVISPDLASKKPSTALVPKVDDLMCAIAGFRREARPGCVAGEVAAAA